MTHTTTPYHGRIITDPAILLGKPVVKGTRIPVSLILNLVEHGYDADCIIGAYPVLTREDIEAALEYSRSLRERDQLRAARRSA
ncbi:MAG: DUF433 domain-containing protein [Chloroflexi bacterium]|nr:DUF433 domain-containing protein [Chloroflexota bacterium]